MAVARLYKQSAASEKIISAASLVSSDHFLSSVKDKKKKGGSGEGRKILGHGAVNDRHFSRNNMAFIAVLMLCMIDRFVRFISICSFIFTQLTRIERIVTDSVSAMYVVSFDELNEWMECCVWTSRWIPYQLQSLTRSSEWIAIGDRLHYSLHQLRKQLIRNDENSHWPATKFDSILHRVPHHRPAIISAVNRLKR